MKIFISNESGKYVLTKSLQCGGQSDKAGRTVFNCHACHVHYALSLIIFSLITVRAMSTNWSQEIVNQSQTWNMNEISFSNRSASCNALWITNYHHRNVYFQFISIDSSQFITNYHHKNVYFQWSNLTGFSSGICVFWDITINQ